MTQVLKADCSLGGTDVYKNTGLSDVSAWYVQFDAAIPTSTMAAIISAEPSGSMYTANLCIIPTAGGNEFVQCGNGAGDAVGLTSPCSVGDAHGQHDLVFPTDAWNTIVLHYDGASTITCTVNGVTYASLGGTKIGIFSGDYGFGGFFANNLAGEVYYIRNVKVGTTAGGTEIFQDSFAAGSLAGWDAVDGAVLVDDPFAGGGGIVLPLPVSPPEGVCIAFDAGPLDATPVWTPIGKIEGVRITGVSITRGRPDETQKTDVGRMTVSGVDQFGVLDPTNHTSPLWDAGVAATKMDPVKQIAFAIKSPVTGAWSNRYVGKIDELTYVIDQSAKFATFTIECVDDLDILNDAEVIPDQAGNTVPGESTGDCYYTGQQVDDRIRAVMADASTAFLGVTWPAGLLRIFSGNVAVQGRVFATRTTLISVIDEACDAEFPGIANRYVDRNGVFTFHGRYARFHPDDVAYNIGSWKIGDIPAFTGDNTFVVLNDPDDPVKFTRGKTNLINCAYSAPIGILPADIAGQFVHNSGSVAKYAPRSVSFDQLTTLQGDESSPLDANQETKLFSTYWVDNYKTPQNRPQSLTVKGVAASSPYATRVWAYLCGVELSDLVHLKTTHPGGGGFDDDFFVEQLKETYAPLQGDQYDVTTTAEVSPRAYFDTNPFTGDTHTT